MRAWPYVNLAGVLVVAVALVAALLHG